MQSRRRITPMAVNTTAKTSLALRKILNEQRNIMKKGREAKKMREILKRMIRNAYIQALSNTRPNASNYQRRISRVRHNSKGPNINFLLFGKNK